MFKIADLFAKTGFQKEPYYSIDILKLFRHLNLIEIKDIDKLNTEKVI